MNEQDSLQMQGLLRRAGFEKSTNPWDADLILLNSCAIREKAVHKIYSDLGRVRLIKEEHPGLILGLAGCVAQQEKENLIKRFPFLDLVFGPDAIRHLPDMVKEVRMRRGGSGERGTTNYPPVVRTCFDSRKDFEFVNLLPHEEENRVKAFVTIQKGCDNVCSFCIVPRVRGPEVSRPANDIVSEIRQLVELGVKEVTLLGQNVNSYGKKGNGISFSQLLERIDGETGIRRLRFTSSHPQDVDDDLVEKFRTLQSLSPHFHLPVQSGSNRILSAMRRHYTREDYLKIIESLKNVLPAIALSTDFIVGYPGETEEDFSATLDLIDKVGFDSSYSFIYSPRPGTASFQLADDVPMAEKTRRLEILNNFQRQISEGKNKKLEGTVEEVLVESYSQKDKVWMGRTGTNKIVHFTGLSAFNEEKIIGEFVNIKIIKANPFSLMGEQTRTPCTEESGFASSELEGSLHREQREREGI